ncbi:MAG: trypsin-like peptidase domain-containing protein [Phycisphaeraceae bacterium]
MPRVRSLPLILAAVALLLAPLTAAAQEAPDLYAKLIADKGPALVTVKFVLKVSVGGAADRQQEAEAPGVLIDESGLVLCSSTNMGGIAKLLAAQAQNVTATPTDIKVLIGDDTEGLEAKLLARDSDLDLAWVQIKDAKSKKLPFVSFAAGVTPRIGQRVLVVRHMTKYFDRSLVVGESHIGGMTSKPRDLYVPNLPLAQGFGFPVFDESGQAVGFSVLQIPEDDGAPGNARFQDATNLVLSANDVARATGRAREAAGPEATTPETPATEAAKPDKEKPDEEKQDAAPAPDQPQPATP